MFDRENNLIQKNANLSQNLQIKFLAVEYTSMELTLQGQQQNPPLLEL